MDPLDELLSDPVVTSRTSSRFQPKIKPRPRKQNLAPLLFTPSHDEKEKVSETNSNDKLSESDEKCYHDGTGDTKSIKSSSEIPVLEENLGSVDDLFMDAVKSDYNGHIYTSTQIAEKVDSTHSDLDSCGSILSLHPITDGDGLVGSNNLSDNTIKVGVLNCSHSSAPTAHEAMILDHSGLGSTRIVEGHTSDAKIVRENVDIFQGLECLDDFHNQPKNDAESVRRRQAVISNEDGDIDEQRSKIELQEGRPDIAMDAISGDAFAPGQPARKYRPKTKRTNAKDDTSTQISQPEISAKLPPSPQVTCDTRCSIEASVAAHQPDGIPNDSFMADSDGNTPVFHQNGEEPVIVESTTYDSYGDILVDDLNSEDPDEVSRRMSGPSGKDKPSMESNISQQQDIGSQVGEEYEHFKSTRKLRKQVYPKVVDEPDACINEIRSFSSEPSDNCELYGDDYTNSETSRGGKSQGKKASRKLSKPSSENEKPMRKRKEASETVQDLQAEKRPKKFSHSTRRRRRQVDKVLLETPEDEIDFQKLKFRDLIIYHEFKEKLAKKEANSRRSASNQRTGNVGEDVFNDEEETPASELGRGTDDDAKNHVVDMTSAYFNYHSFMDKTPRIKWSKQDTQLFYEAVRQFGTDFCMIQQLFPGRTRHQIKLKFKNEERYHPLQLLDAMTNRAKDHSHFISVIGQLQEAASKAKHECNQDELTEITGEEDVDELSPETNDEVAKPGMEETDVNGKEEFGVEEIHSPLKFDDESDDDPCRWDEYKCDF